MRADRLLSLLMLLQTRGRTTARQLGEILEVSERTILRDLDALSSAGIPVYAERGPGGGCDLLDSYRTSLTGLGEEEIRALFMLSIPAPLGQLGFSHDLHSALLKLSAALPAAFKHEERWVRQRIHLDSVWWHQAEEAVPHLSALQEAVWRDHRVRVRYQMPFKTEIEWVLNPYGLVAKAGIWYLVYALKGAVRALRVSRLLEVEILSSTFERPPAFDLAGEWNAWCSTKEQIQTSYRVLARASVQILEYFPYLTGQSLEEVHLEVEPPDEAGWVRITLRFENLEAARARLLGLGGAIEVLEPEALRRSLLDFAIQTVQRYQPEKPTHNPS